jgi:nucleotide-binding universal stress UspA family protein
LHALAEEHAADLLVVGSTSRGLAGRVLVGDDTRASLNGAPCAVAVAPLGYVARTGGFFRIGVGYDFSGESQAALALARALASRDSAKLSALHVVPLPTAGYLAPMPGTWGEILEEDREAARGFRQQPRPPGGGFAQLRAGATPGVWKHLEPPGTQRPLPAAGPAALGDRDRFIRGGAQHSQQGAGRRGFLMLFELGEHCR